MIKEYIEDKYGFKVHTAYIAEVRRSLGLPMYDAPNAVEELKHPTAEKVEAIKDGPGRAVMDAGLDDLAFIKGDMKILFRRSHKRYPPPIKARHPDLDKDNDMRRKSKCNLQFVETKCNFGSLRVAFTFSLQR